MKSLRRHLGAEDKEIFSKKFPGDFIYAILLLTIY